MNILTQLLSNDEQKIDSIVFMALMALGALIGVTAYVVIQDHTQFNPVAFSGSALTIIGAGAGSRTARDRWSNPNAQGPQQ